MPRSSKNASQPKVGKRPAPKSRARPVLRIAILSRKEALYSTRRLMEATAAAGHKVVVLDTLRCRMVLKQSSPELFYEDHSVTHVGVVIPRIGASITSYGLAVVNQFEMMGVPVVNPSMGIFRSRDKLRCLQILAQQGLDIPRTVMARDRTGIEQAVEQVGGLPAIIKLIQGTQGVGVMIAHTMDEIRTILDTFWSLGQEILLQEFIAESRGADVRALVVGDRVVGAMRRKARAGEFRSNLHRGGRGMVLELTPELTETALRAARGVGLDIAGVDMLESRTGPKIMEVNSSPGFEGLEGATGLDIAGEMIAHAVRRAHEGSRAPPGEPTRIC